jgi:capsular exopolysaccharide synthesis family protein
MAIVMNALGKALEDENQAHEDQNQYKLIEQLEAKRTEGSTKLEQQWKVYNLRMRGVADEDQTKKMLDSAWQQFREDEKTLKDLGVQIVKTESAINNLSKAKDITQVPSDQVAELVKNDPSAAPLFVEQQKTLKELNDATKRTSVQSYLQPYVDHKAAADQAIEDYKAQNYPEILQRYREKMMNVAAAEMRKQRDDLANLKEQERKVAENVAFDKGELLKIKPNVSLPPDVVALKNQILALESAQGDATKKIALLAFDAPKQRVTVHETAIVPGSVDYTRFTKLAGAGGLGGFFLALLAVSFREFRYRKICTTEEVSRGLGLPLIGTVPTLPDAARSSLVGQGKVDPVWQNQLLESVDTIRTLLLHNARAANTRVIMISSAVGGEGKTSLATQLAASLARAWKKTLLIDGDLRSPSAHKLFEVPQEPGFSEVLRGELGAAEAIRSTPLSRLWIMPAGHWDSHAVQALAQDSVRTILEELKQQYDFIILDSSPILPVADALLLGQNVDGVLLTVMRDLSRAPALHAAHQRLEGLGIKTLGAVMMGASNELGPLGYKYAAIARR